MKPTYKKIHPGIGQLHKMKHPMPGFYITLNKLNISCFQDEVYELQHQSATFRYRAMPSIQH